MYRLITLDILLVESKLVVIILHSFYYLRITLHSGPDFLSNNMLAHRWFYCSHNSMSVLSFESGALISEYHLSFTYDVWMLSFQMWGMPIY